VPTLPTANVATDEAGPEVCHRHTVCTGGEGRGRGIGEGPRHAGVCSVEGGVLGVQDLGVSADGAIIICVLDVVQFFLFGQVDFWV